MQQFLNIALFCVITVIQVISTKPVLSYTKTTHDKTTGIWQAIGTEDIKEVVDIIEYDSKIYVLQTFIWYKNFRSNQSAYVVSSWDGNNWSSFLGPAFAVINGIKVLNNKLIVYGIIEGINQIKVNNIGVWDGKNWSSLIDSKAVEKAGMPRDIYDVEIFKNNIYVCGNFIDIKINKTHKPLSGIGKWNGTDWESLDKGLNELPIQMLSTKNFLYVGGAFTASGNKALHYIAKWDGVSWYSLAGGLDGHVNVLFKDGDDIYVGGNFEKTKSGIQLNYIGKWDGKKWVPLKEGLNYYVNSIAKYKNDLYVAGGFSQASSKEVNFIARWDGNNWYPLKEGGVNEGYVNKVAVYKDKLYIGGWFKKYIANTNQNITNIAIYKLNN